MTAPSKGALRGWTLLRSSLLSGVVTVADLLPGGSPPPLTLPSNLTAPSISGTASQGSTLTRTAGSWSGNPVPSVSADWQRNGVSTGQSGLTYNLTLADVGETITVVETATNSQGSATSTSNGIGPISGTQTAPSNTTPASISGTAQVGSTLTAVAGSWSGNPTPSVSGQWRRGGVAISGATALTYVLVSADQGQTIDYYETATNSQGTAYQPSNSLGPVTASGGGGILSAPTLDYPTTANPPTLGVHIGADWITGDILKLQIDTDLAFTTPAPTLLTHTIVDADTVPGATITMTIPTLTGVNYFRAYGNDGTADSNFKSNIVAWGDSTAPSITNTGTASVTETSQLAVAITASEAIASAQIAGGVDQLQFEVVNVSGTWTLRWINNGSQNYATPLDLGGDNVYNVDVTATDYAGNVSAVKSFAVTVTQIDQSPAQFTFADVSNASLSTVYTSNTITLSGMTPGFNIPATVTGGLYSKNGGAFTPAGSFTVQNGDTIALQVTSGSGNSMAVSSTLSVGSGPAVSDTYTVTTPGSAAALVTTSGVDKSASITVWNNNRAFYANSNVGSVQAVSANVPASADKFHYEMFLDSQEAGSSSNVFWGIFDGSRDLSAALSPQPGDTGGGAGFTIQTRVGINTAGINKNGGFVGWTLPKNAAIGDGFIIEVNKTTITAPVVEVWFWDNTGGTATLMGTYTLSSLIPATGSWFAWGAAERGAAGAPASSDGGSFNFGATTFHQSPTAGYTYYA